MSIGPPGLPETSKRHVPGGTIDSHAVPANCGASDLPFPQDDDHVKRTSYIADVDEFSTMTVSIVVFEMKGSE